MAGSSTNFVTFNAANNINGYTNLAGVVPSAVGEIIVSMAPTANNNNAYHFTYLGVLRVDPVRPPRLQSPALGNGQATISWSGAGFLEWAPSVAGPWTRIMPPPASPYSESFVPGTNRFFRIIQHP